jgi:hypothetical protein
VEGHGFVALVLPTPPTVLSNFLSCGGADAWMSTLGNVGPAPTTVTMHAVVEVFKRMARSTIKSGKERVPTEALEAEEGEQVLMTEVATCPRGAVVVLKEIVVLATVDAQGHAKSF